MASRVPNGPVSISTAKPKLRVAITSATAFRAASEQITFWSEPLKEEAEITGPAAGTVICRILDDGCRYLRDVARVRAERS